MPYSHPFLRLVVAGSLFSAEQFSFSMSFIQKTTTPSAPVVVPPALITALNVFWQSTGTISQYAKLERIKLNLIGEDGKYVNSTTVEYEYPTPLPGASTIGPAPQVALVATLGTTVRRGRAHAGRFYLPMPGEPLQGDGRLHPTFASVTSVLLKTMLQAFNTALATDWKLGVVSNLGAGTQREVSEVRVGRVLDTMRSRRTSLDEAYAIAAITP